MGKGYVLKCSKCNYSFEVNFGVGFMFLQEYQKTMEAARKGKLGEDVQAFLAEHSDGILDSDHVLLQCTSCGNLDRGADLSMYVPIDKPIANAGKWSGTFTIEGETYAVPWELKERYQFVKPYDHICKKCKGKMRVIKEEDLISGDQEYKGIGVKVNLNCPKCQEHMIISGIIMWD